MPTIVRIHHIRRFSAEARIDGQKVQVFCFSCSKCSINQASYSTRHGRDKAADLHQLEPTK